MAPADRVPFIIIGENVHATRSFARKGRNIVKVGDDEAVAFKDPQTGEDRICPIAEPVAASNEFAKQKVKHIRNALLLGMAGDGALEARLTGPVSEEAAQAGKDYLIAAALRQQRNGAHYIDVNVDEMSPDEGVRIAAMEWLVRLLEPVCGVPLSLDSSSLPVLEAGFRSSVQPSGPLMLNSASAERPEALDLAAANGAAVVLSAAGIGGLPSTVAGRIENGNAIYAQALERGIKPADCHVDLLVLPVGVDSEAGNTFIGAAAQFRAQHGPEVRLTGGLSNVSFGLPNRKLINDAFLALAMDAGVDSGIVDPNVINPDKVRAMDRGGRPFKLAADVLTGVDLFAMEYLDAFRAGELGGE